MVERSTPHYHNQSGYPSIRVGSRKFMCVGALPPFDHPHVFIDMGDESEAVCPYCSTLYRFDPSLHGKTDPPDCVFTDQAAA